jgi:hypothetical protein
MRLLTPRSAPLTFAAPRSRAWRILLVIGTSLTACGHAESRPALSADGRPKIASFTATPSALPTGGGSAVLAWQVSGATMVAIDNGVGTVTGSSVSVNVTATKVFTLTASNASGSTQASTAVYVDSGAVGWDPAAGTFSAMMSPQDGETLVPSAAGLIDLRLVAAARDASGFATQVRFMVDSDPSPLLTVNLGDGGTSADALATSADFWVYRGFASRALTPGTHAIFARATVSGTTLDSPPVVITVETPAYGQTKVLSANVTDLAGAGLATIVGSPGSRIRIEGAGFSITGSSPVNWQYVDFYNVGSASTPDTTSLSVIASSDTINVQNCRFFYSNPTQFVVNGSASASIRGNTWASNVRQLAGQFPADAGSPTATQVVALGGTSTAAKVFAGNNIGAGYVRIVSGTQNWTLGGDAEADANVMIGPRIGWYFEGSTAGRNSTVVGNYTHFPYWGGWSQAANYELNGTTALIEKNIIIFSSWPIRGAEAEFRYNLVIANNEGGIWPSGNSYIHHNLFVGNSGDRAAVYAIYGGSNRVYNNTFDFLNGVDMGGQYSGVLLTSGSLDLESNIFANITVTSNPGVIINSGGTMTAGYNDLWNATGPSLYSGVSPGTGATTANPQWVDAATHYFYWSLSDVWRRVKTPRQILADYRARYTPTAPLGGDTSAFGAGNTIGAIGATGAAAAYDLFGK